MDADKKRLWVSGQFIEVTDEVYDAYMKGDRKMRYFESDLKTERFLMDENGQIRQVIPSREDSLDRLMDDNAEQFADRHESVEDMVLRRISIERLYKALDRLTEKERKLMFLKVKVWLPSFVLMVKLFLHHLKSSIQSAVFALLSNTFKPLMVSHAL